MSIRETLQDSKGVGVAVGVVLIAVAAVAIVAQTRSDGPAGHGDLAFFSDDDGKTWFTDSTHKFPPFDHNGKQAYRAGVYKGNRGEFVAFLQRITPDGLKQLKAADDREKAQPASKTAQVDGLLGSRNFQQGALEVKVPGAGNPWMPMYKFDFRQIKAADGQPAEPVLP